MSAWYIIDISLIYHWYFKLYKFENMWMIYPWYIKQKLWYINFIIFEWYIKKKIYQWYIKLQYIIWSRNIKMIYDILDKHDISGYAIFTLIYQKRYHLFDREISLIYQKLSDIWTKYHRDISRYIIKMIYHADISESWVDISWYIADISPL